MARARDVGGPINVENNINDITVHPPPVTVDRARRLCHVRGSCVLLTLVYLERRACFCCLALERTSAVDDGRWLGLERSGMEGLELGSERRRETWNLVAHYASDSLALGTAQT